MAKTVSVAYCGGCNASFDRPGFVRDLLNEVKAAGGAITLVDTTEPSDIALVIAGCQAICVADREDFGPNAKKRYVVGPNSLNALSMPFEDIHKKLKTDLLA